MRSAVRTARAPGADLIEAGLNEGAGRFALAALWVLCRAASDCRRSGLQPSEASVIVLTSDRKQIGVRSRGERAPMASDAGRDAVRAQIASTASNWRRGGRDAKRDVGGILIVALMKCRTKTATYWTEAVGRAGKVGDDAHDSSAFRTGRRIKVDGFARRGCWQFYLSARRRFVPVGQERATEGELLRSVAIGEEAEVANAMEAVG